MRVGVFVSGHTPESGGGFTFQDDIIQALSRLDSKHEFVIFSQSTKGKAIEAISDRISFVYLRPSFAEQTKAELAGITSAIVKRLPIIRRHIKVTRRNCLKQALADYRIEFVWFPTPVYFEADVPYIYTVWDLQHRLQPWFPEVSANGEWRGREHMYANAIPRASAIIIGTESGKEEIVQFYQVPAERVKMIPHPTPSFTLNASQDISEDVLTKYHIPKGYLFYPAQFWPHKNHVGLLSAVKLLREKYNLVLPVVLVGSDMGNLQYVRQMVDRLGLSPQVYFLGFVPRKDLVGLYRNAFALTYLTFFGPENLPPLEAFALGCPVIASKVSGAEEQLGDAALLVDPKDERQIADAIKRLHEDATLRDTLVSRGKARAAKWTAEDFVKSVSSLLDEFEPIRRCWGR